MTAIAEDGERANRSDSSWNYSTSPVIDTWARRPEVSGIIFWEWTSASGGDDDHQYARVLPREYRTLCMSC